MKQDENRCILVAIWMPGCNRDHHSLKVFFFGGEIHPKVFILFIRHLNICIYMYIRTIICMQPRCG